MKKIVLDKYDKIEITISTILKLFIVGLVITSIIRGQYFLAFSSILILFMMFLPSLIDKKHLYYSANRI